MILGCMHSARAIATRCCCPPESWAGYLCKWSAMRTWRKLASRWNRGIAQPGKGVPGATKTSSIRLRRLAQGKAPGYFVEKIDDVNNY